MAGSYSKSDDHSWAWALLGLLAGGAIVYVATRPKIQALENKVNGLERQVVYLNQTVSTLEGHLQSLQGYLKSQELKLQHLELEFSDLGGKYDALLTDLDYVEAQLTDGQAKKALKALIERAKRRKLERVKTLSN